MKYTIKKHISIVQTFEVEAEDSDTAINKVESGEAQYVDADTHYNWTVEEPYEP